MRVRLGDARAQRLYDCDDTEGSALQSLLAAIPSIQGWIASFRVQSPLGSGSDIDAGCAHARTHTRTQGHTRTPATTHVLCVPVAWWSTCCPPSPPGHVGRTRLAVTSVHSVEDKMWSPMWGLKGVLDLTVDVLARPVTSGGLTRWVWGWSARGRHAEGACAVQEPHVVPLRERWPRGPPAIHSRRWPRGARPPAPGAENGQACKQRRRPRSPCSGVPVLPPPGGPPVARCEPRCASACVALRRWQKRSRSRYGAR